jgi:DNA-binding NarL/FixJ family response regulator
MLEARLVDSPVRSLIVDLESGATGMALIRRLRDESADEKAKAIRIVAFGPHVAVDMFQEAKRAGADAVMPRGAFSARLPEILRQLAGEPSAVKDDLHE